MVKVEEIDIQRSKNTQRLFLKRTFLDEILAFVFKTFLIFILPIITIAYSFNHRESFSQDKFGYIMSFLVSLMIAYLIYNYFNNINEIKIVQGKEISLNKNIIVNIAEKLGWEIYDNKNDIIILKPGWHRQIVVIFDYDNLLINTIRFGKYETPSFGQINGTFDNLNYEILYRELKPEFDLPILDLSE